MTPQRILLITLLAAVAISLAAAANDLIVGVRKPNDYLIQRDNVYESASIIGRVTVTKTFDGNNFANITQVRALDQHKNGHGATAKIIAGGVGSTFVTLKFESELFRAIDFKVELYGK